MRIRDVMTKNQSPWIVRHWSWMLRRSCKKIVSGDSLSSTKANWWGSLLSTTFCSLAITSDIAEYHELNYLLARMK